MREVSIDEAMKIPLGRSGLFTLVDPEWYEMLTAITWRISQKRGHPGKYVYPNKGYLPMHRLIMSAPKGLCVDHINGDGLDNRTCNLRLCTVAENNANRHTTHSSSGYRGVHKAGPYKGKWWVRLGVQKKKIHIGTFDCLEIAVHTYNEAARHYYGEFAFQNVWKGKNTARIVTDGVEGGE